MYVCMYDCIYVWMCICMRVYTYVCIYEYVCRIMCCRKRSKKIIKQNSDLKIYEFLFL